MALSFRVKLSLWNGAVMAVVLGGFGLAIVFAAQSRLEDSVDRELRERAHRFQQMSTQFGRGFPGGGGRDGDPRGQGGPRPDGTPGGPSRPEVGGGQQGPTDPNRPFGVQSPGFDPQTERLAALRRPRFLSSEGKGLGTYALGPWDAALFKDALKGKEGFSTMVAEGQRIRVVCVPWKAFDGKPGAIQIARELSDVEQGWGRQFGALATLLPLALLVAGIGGLFLTGRALRPVRRVTEAAEEIGAHDLSRRLEVDGEDELGRLATTFNGMIERLEDAFDRQRRFTADASHELRTPLTRIKLATSSALEGEGDLERYRRALEVSDRAADSMTRLVQQLLLLARTEGAQIELKEADLDAGDLLRESAAAVPGLGDRFSVSEPVGAVRVRGDAEFLRRIFENLLENAARHTPEGGRIEAEVEVRDSTVVVQVRDTGEGIAAEHLDKLTERFYRVDDARARADGGCGLGLSISKGLVEAHGGILRFESEVGVGTTVTVELPGRAVSGA